MGKLFSGGDWWVFWMIYGCALGWQFLYAVTGLQLGRAHLKLYLRPWEVPPTRAVVSLLFFLPFILLAGAIGLMFWGFPIVLGFVIFAVCRYDRQLTPTPSTVSRPAASSTMATADVVVMSWHSLGFGSRKVAIRHSFDPARERLCSGRGQRRDRRFRHGC